VNNWSYMLSPLTIANKIKERLESLDRFNDNLLGENESIPECPVTETVYDGFDLRALPASAGVRLDRHSFSITIYERFETDRGVSEIALLGHVKPVVDAFNSGDRTLDGTVEDVRAYAGKAGMATVNNELYRIITIRIEAGELD
jgi:hypothetical protein